MTMGQNTIGGELLRRFVERIEHINEQMKQLGADKAVIMSEAKRANLVPAGISYVVRKRKMKPSDRQESEALEDMYLHAMGMAADNPLFRMVGLMKVDVASKDSVIEAMKKFVPTNGSIEVDAGGGPRVRLTRDKEGNVSVTEVVEKPMQPAARNESLRPPKADVPDVDAATAEQLGRDAFKADVAIIENPFPYGDERRARWDKGWCDESGSDGMDD
jgi:uncharacterized protein (UPF0335 family)